MQHHTIPKAPGLMLLLTLLAAAPAVGDDCRDAALAANPAAETLCSDAIARLSYQADTGAGPSDRAALAAAYANRGMARTAAGDLSGASEDLEQALTLAGEHWAIYLNRGNLHLAANQPQAALADYARAQALSAAAAEAVLKNSVLAYRALGDTGRATASLVGAGSISRRPASGTPGEPGLPRR